MTQGLAVTILVLASATSAVADTSDADPRLAKHHVSIQLGPFNPAAERMELGSVELVLEGEILLGIIGYRYTLTPHMDLDLEIRHWIGRWPIDGDGYVKFAAGFIGPGIRWNARDRTLGHRVIPYLKGNLYYVQEQVQSSEPSIVHDAGSGISGGIGLGVSGGVDIQLARVISIPIEVTYLVNGGRSLGQLSGFGISVGVSVNF